MTIATAAPAPEDPRPDGKPKRPRPKLGSVCPTCGKLIRTGETHNLDVSDDFTECRTWRP